MKQQLLQLDKATSFTSRDSQTNDVLWFVFSLEGICAMFMWATLSWWAVGRMPTTCRSTTHAFQVCLVTVVKYMIYNAVHNVIWRLFHWNHESIPNLLTCELTCAYIWKLLKNRSRYSRKRILQKKHVWGLQTPLDIDLSSFKTINYYTICIQTIHVTRNYYTRATRSSFAHTSRDPGSWHVQQQ